MKKIISLLLAMAMIFALCSCAGSSEPKQENASEAENSTPEQAPVEESQAQVVWKVSCIDAEGSDYMNAFTAMWERVEEETNGYIDVELYYSSQLGEESEVLEGIQLGTIQGAQMATSVMANYSEYFYVNDLPFLFENFKRARRPRIFAHTFYNKLL